MARRTKTILACGACGAAIPAGSEVTSRVTFTLSLGGPAHAAFSAPVCDRCAAQARQSPEAASRALRAAGERYCSGGCR